MENEDITILKRENLVWTIYILFAFFGIRANNLEIEDLENHNHKNRKKYKSINRMILFLALLIYFYFEFVSYNRYKKRHTKGAFLTLIASSLIFIAGLLLLYVELFTDEIVPNE